MLHCSHYILTCCAQAFLTKLLTVDLPGLIVLPKRLDINIPPAVTAVAEAAVGRDAVMRAVASAVLQVQSSDLAVGRDMANRGADEVSSAATLSGLQGLAHSDCSGRCKPLSAAAAPWPAPKSAIVPQGSYRACSPEQSLRESKCHHQAVPCAGGCAGACAHGCPSLGPPVSSRGCLPARLLRWGAAGAACTACHCKTSACTCIALHRL